MRLLKASLAGDSDTLNMTDLITEEVLQVDQQLLQVEKATNEISGKYVGAVAQKYKASIDLCPKMMITLTLVAIMPFIKPRPCFAWRGFLFCVCLSVCLCVCVCVCLLTRYLKNYLTNQLHFWWGPSP